jgi:hypothetical protein
MVVDEQAPRASSAKQIETEVAQRKWPSKASPSQNLMAKNATLA